MPRAVRYDNYGPVDVLHVVEVDMPQPQPDEVIVEVVAAGINPGEIGVREGAVHHLWPASFPSGQGNDFAGRVTAVGSDVEGFDLGAEVIGFSDRRDSQADYVAVPADHLTAKPPGLGWNEAGSLYGAGVTAYAAVRAVSLKPGDTVAISGAAGGVGTLASQLARRAGARVLGIAGPANADWLTSIGAIPIAYGDGLADRLRAAAPDGIDAFIDTFGSGYVELAIELGVDPRRIDTIIDVAAAEKYGVKTDASAEASNPTVLAELAHLVADKELALPIAVTYPLEQVREAYTQLGQRHTHGKIVLTLRSGDTA
jgi:NADPH:quinone reductase-like Zn-dependent oxidoreductase